jgi:hypothetical protein
VAFMLFTLAPTTEVSGFGEANRVEWDVNRAVIVSGGNAVAEVFAFVLVMAARRTRGWTMRAAAYSVGMLAFVLVLVGVGVAAVAAVSAADEYAGDTAETYTAAALIAFCLAAGFHLVAVLMLAMPSVSTWIDTAPQAVATPARFPTAPVPGGYLPTGHYLPALIRLGQYPPGRLTPMRHPPGQAQPAQSPGGQSPPGQGWNGQPDWPKRAQPGVHQV